MSRITHPRRAVLPLTLACIAAAWWGCTAQPETNTFTSSSSAGPTGSSSVSGSGGGSSSSSGMGGSGGGEINFDAGTDGDIPLDDAGVCSSTSAAAQQIQLDMIVLIDKSGSMSGTKWTGTTTALKSFFNDPASAGIGAGLVYFPNDNANDCVFSDYAILDVAVGLLPGNAQALISSMPPDANGGDTPTYGALKGALYAATAYQDANPTHKVVLVFATDGDPTACAEQSIPVIAGLAQSAHNYNGVLTYVIGVQGSTIANLDAIAAAGGTTKAFDITGNISLFAAKMAEIRTAAIGCEFIIPKPPNNQMLDPDKVNVQYTPKGMANPKILPRADNLADCGGMPGWYYDNNLTPTKITLCPASCMIVQADSKAKIDVLFGCKSKIN